MAHREQPVDSASDALRREVEEASGMQPGADSPRHRSPWGGFVEPAPGRRVDAGTPGSIVFSPDPGRYPRHAGDPDDHRVGFRSPSEVNAEMSPVIYRPAGSGDREPERPPRVPISGPDIPTAASFADDQPPPANEAVAPDEDEDETVAAAPPDPEPEPEPEPRPEPEPEPTPRRRGPLQRRRRRLLGRSVEPSEPPVEETIARRLAAHDAAPEQAPEPARETQPEPEAPDDTTEPDDAELDETALDETGPDEAVPDETGPDETGPDETSAPPAPASDEPRRRRRVRSLHIAPPPVGTGDDPNPEHGETDESAPAPAERVTEAAPRPVDEPPAPAPDPRWRQAAPPRYSSVVRPAEDEPLVEEAVSDDSTDEPARHAREAAAVSGHVVSSRGRGLSGIAVVVIDADDQVVGSTITGRRGHFVVEDLTAGTYRLGARDSIDGDFVDSWHGGDDAADATELVIEDGHTLHDIDVTLIGRAAIGAEVDVRRKKVVIDVEVIDRTTGEAGVGSVVISTDEFRTRLPLVEGRTTITLFGTTDEDGADDSGLHRLGRRVRLEYPGSKHNGPVNRTIWLR
jgi:hypothetical protein